jgi:hypothetical protein
MTFPANPADGLKHVEGAHEYYSFGGKWLKRPPYITTFSDDSVFANNQDAIIQRPGRLVAWKPESLIIINGTYATNANSKLGLGFVVGGNAVAVNFPGTGIMKWHNGGIYIWRWIPDEPNLDTHHISLIPSHKDARRALYQHKRMFFEVQIMRATSSSVLVFWHLKYTSAANQTFAVNGKGEWIGVKIEDIDQITLRAKKSAGGADTFIHGSASAEWY